MRKISESRANPNIALSDPDNAIYDDLDLNRGLKETFFTPSTPLSFLERFTEKDGMNNLMEVLSKWNEGMYSTMGCLLRFPFLFIINKCIATAVYIPPKQAQAFNQGGTFIFNGEKTIFAHYDGTSLLSL